MANNLLLRSILDANKLIGPNFLDSFRNLKIVLKQEKKSYIFDTSIPPVPTTDANVEDKEAHQRHKDDDDQAACVMLASMTLELQKQDEHMDVQSMILHLRELFDKEGRTERYEISKELFRCKMAEGSSVKPHVLKMIGPIERLGQLGLAMYHELSINLVLQSLPDSFSQFVLNFHMNRLEATLPKLLNMLDTAEKSIRKHKGSLLLISSSKAHTKQHKKKAQKEKKVKSQNEKALKPKGGVKKDKEKDICDHCGKLGHWRRNCKEYLVTVSKKKKLIEVSDSGTKDKDE
ncbi:Retrotransposon protein, putative [Theobroma cacao]|uniref:Retrotransposon protein, putative n=1 Tax=Theobroma cacao TaxID=3641 RepID=A0A061EGC0_THECC|nr:Retrotransposon protein, putative [Theobroma cacao]